MQSLDQPPEQASLASLSARLTLSEKIHRQEIEAGDASIAARDLQIKLLTEQVRLLKAQKFGASDVPPL